jgi:serine protease
MFRFMLAALAAAALTTSARADGKEPKINSAIAAKTGTASEIAGAIAETGTVRVLVTVKPSSGASVEDLSAAARTAATRAAVKSQVKAALDSVLSSHKLSHVSGAKGAPALIRLTTTPAFSALVDEAELVALAKDPRVLSIQFDRPMKKQLAVTVPFIGMPSVHTAGGTGVGRTVAVIDDGIQRNHIFVGLSRLHSGREACFLSTNDCPDGTNEQIGTGASAVAPGASHGMHVSGIVLGNNAGTTPSKGVAPKAKLVPINIFGPSTGTANSTIQRAFEYVEDLVLLSGGSNPLKIDAINMSVGGGASAGICDADADMALLKPVVDNLHKKGVVSVVAAGNESERGKMSFPACLSTIFSVAATSRSGVTASYTNISPSTDVFAPGGEFGDCVISSVPTDGFGAKCGTSMAAPHVAGAVAALRSLFPSATACQIEEALIRTGIPTSDLRDGGTLTKQLIRVSRARLRLLSPVAPGNDNFAAAAALPPNAIEFSTGGATNVGATTEPGEPSFSGTGNAHSVWWKWTPSVSGAVAIDTLGSGFDTVLAVYSGATSVTNRGTRVALNDNISATEKRSRVAFSAVAGTTYHIVVLGRSAAEECAISLNITRPPLNDNFARAKVVTVPVVTEVNVSGSNARSTFEAGEPAPNGVASSNTTVWFRFTAQETKVITLDTLGSQFDTVLSVFKGSAVNALTRVAVNDDFGGTSSSRLTFQMTAGTTYHIQLAGFAGAQGRYRLSFTPSGAQSVESVKASLSE